MKPRTNGAIPPNAPNACCWTRVGFWSEGSAIDRWDKALSRPVFYLELPALLEQLVAVPFLMHGAVALSLGTWGVGRIDI